MTPDSQLRKLPVPMMAQRIAMRLKGQTPKDSPELRERRQLVPRAHPEGGPPAGAPAAGMVNGGGNARGGGDLQQMLSRLPAVTVNDFQKGDAVMLGFNRGHGFRGYGDHRWLVVWNPS